VNQGNADIKCHNILGFLQAMFPIPLQAQETKAKLRLTENHCHFQTRKQEEHYS
jgi:hypothetical protein